MPWDGRRRWQGSLNGQTVSNVAARVWVGPLAGVTLFGAYQAGTDQDIDRAIVAAPHIREFIAQDESSKVDMNESRAALAALLQLSNVATVGAES